MSETTEPPPPQKRVKDPKKVAVGLQPAVKTWEAREALAHEKMRGKVRSETPPEEEAQDENFSGLPLSTGMMMALGGLETEVTSLYL